jgi:hypothetical protein
VSNARTRAIRALMAETGMKYTAAMREHDRRRAAAADGAPADDEQPEQDDDHQ